LRERWPGALFVVGRPTSPVSSRPARCRVEHLGGSGGFLGAVAAAKEAGRWLNDTTVSISSRGNRIASNPTDGPGC